MDSQRIFITGGNGQLGTALKSQFPRATFVDRDDCDITDEKNLEKIPWNKYDVIINAAAFTAVDAAETSDGRIAAWQVNATAVRHLARIATTHDLVLVHISSDYVFDGSKDNHNEDEPFSPLGVYGQSKAAGDIAASLTSKYYLLRTSWVVGEGKNFVLTMMELAKKGVKPSVVSDQIGRLTFTSELAEGIRFLLEKDVAFGVYNLTNDGQSESWAKIAQEIFTLSGSDGTSVTPISTEEYFKGKTGIAPRPLSSSLNLEKIKSVGYQPKDWRVSLEEYVRLHL